MKTLHTVYTAAILAVTLAVSTLLQARETADFYSAVVPVADHSGAARAEAVQQGMREVLIRLTGVSDVASRPQSRDILANVNAYVVEYSYATLDSEHGDLGLKVQYDRAGVDRYLRARGLPIWPLNRPPMLVWLVADSPLGETAFVTAAQAEALQRSLGKAFDRRGMPVVYPRYDALDQQAFLSDPQVLPSDLQALPSDPQALPSQKAPSFATEAIARASARYPVEGWLLVRLYQPAGESWRGAWAMGRDDQSIQQEVEAASLEALLQAVVDQSVDTVAADFSYVARQTADQVEIDVRGITSFKAYNNLIGVLEDMSIIRSVEVMGLDGDRVQLVLDIEGERTHLMDSLHRHPGIEALNADGSPRSKELPARSGAATPNFAGDSAGDSPATIAAGPPGAAGEDSVNSPMNSPLEAAIASPEQLPATQFEGVQHLRWIGGR